MKSDIRIAKDPKSGRPILVGSGEDEETGEVQGHMALTPEVVGSWMERVADPMAWVANTRDRQIAERQWRAEEDQRGIENKRADKQLKGQLGYWDKQGRAALTNASGRGESGGIKDKDRYTRRIAILNAMREMRQAVTERGQFGEEAAVLDPQERQVWNMLVSDLKALDPGGNTMVIQNPTTGEVREGTLGPDGQYQWTTVVGGE